MGVVSMLPAYFVVPHRPSDSRQTTPVVWSTSEDIYCYPRHRPEWPRFPFSYRHGAADLGARLSLEEVGDGDGRQDRDDSHHDQKLDQGEAALSHGLHRKFSLLNNMKLIFIIQ